ncbi:MAG: hypothetical protein PHY12_10085 [Eubacteriales bacterium]|nr:hypothetical protein [Eubacteriales bacterium]
MKELNREQLLRAYPQTPALVNERIDGALAAIRRQSQQPPKRYAVRLRFATAVMALALLLAAAAVAAGVHFGVFDFMTELFGQSGVLPQAGELVQENLASLDLPHTVVTVRQAVYDGGNLRMVYSVCQKNAAAPLTADELDDPGSGFRLALAADGVSAWGCDWFYVVGVEYTMTGGSASATIPGAENGEALCYMDVYLASSGIVPTGDFKVSLPLIRRDTSERDTLDFTVKATADTFTPLVRQVNGATVTVRSAFLSPVRSYVNLHIQIDDGISTLQGELLLADWQDATLTDAQGNELAKCSELQTLAETKGVSADYSFTFFPTDAAEVFIAPTVIDQSDYWFVDMVQAIQLKPTLDK